MARSLQEHRAMSVARMLCVIVEL